MMACIQSVAMFGSELWWKGDHIWGTMGQASELQLLVNQETQATTGCFRTTNLGALSMESGLWAATTQLGNRQRWFGLWLLSLPEGDQARELVGAPTGIGWWLKNALAYGGQTERIVLLEELETCNAELLQEEEAEAKAGVEGTRPGLTMFTDVGIASCGSGVACRRKQHRCNSGGSNTMGSNAMATTMASGSW